MKLGSLKDDNRLVWDKLSVLFSPSSLLVSHPCDIIMQGSSFATICEMTDVFEGSIVRFMRRLDELIGQLIKAATVSCLPFLQTVMYREDTMATQP